MTDDLGPDGTFIQHWMDTNPYRMADELPLLKAALHARHRLNNTYIVLRLVEALAVDGLGMEPDPGKADPAAKPDLDMRAIRREIKAEALKDPSKVTKLVRVQVTGADRPEEDDGILLKGSEFPFAHALPCNLLFVDWSKNAGPKRLYDYAPYMKNTPIAKRIKDEVFNHMDRVHSIVNKTDSHCERMRDTKFKVIYGMTTILADACLEVGREGLSPMQVFEDTVVPGYKAVAEAAREEVKAMLTREERRAAESKLKFFPHGINQLPKTDLATTSDDPRLSGAAKVLKLKVLDEYCRAPRPSRDELEAAAADYIGDVEATFRSSWLKRRMGTK
jgi:hypothetical protein